MAINFNEDHKGQNFTTGDVTINYANLATPDKPKSPKIAPTYNCKLTFRKDSEAEMATFAEIQKTVMTVVKEAFPGITKKELGDIRLPWKDGDTEYPNASGAFADMVRGCMVIEPKCPFKKDDGTTNPPIPCFEASKNANGTLIKRDPRDIVSGNIVRVNIRFFGYSGFGGGISARLRAVQYRDEGEAFGTDYGFGEDTPVIGEATDDLEKFM